MDWVQSSMEGQNHLLYALLSQYYIGHIGQTWPARFHGHLIAINAYTAVRPGWPLIV